MARYLLTGTAGFIGSRVADLLLAGGDAVVGVDDMNDAYDQRLKQWRLRTLEPQPAFRFVHADVRDRATVSQLFDSDEAFDAIIHLAARAGVRASVEDPWVYLETNAGATLNLLDACVRYGIGKFVFSSSSSVYGADAPAPCPETAPIDRPLSPYAASKTAGEVMCHSYHVLHGIDISMLRYFTVFGPAGRPDMAPFRFVQWISEGRPVILYGDGTQRRDFTYIDDIAQGTIAALRPVGCEAINLGSDRPVPLMDLVHWIEELTERKARIERHPMHAADVQSTWASIDKAERLLGWRPTVEVQEGLRRLVAWYRENRAWAAQVRTG